MNEVYLLLGSNLSDPNQQLQIAAKYIEESIGKIEKQSSLYQTEAWGNTLQPDFLNQVLILKTNLTAEEILDRIFEIEMKMGRIRTQKNGPRIIDIDILFYNNDIVRAKHLSIPHLTLQERRFVLVPLDEISPHLIHPVLNKTIHTLLSECPDMLDVKKF